MYGSFTPAGSMHGYFAWYEPLVAGLTGLAVLAVGGVVLAAALGRGRTCLRAFLPAPRDSSAVQVARLAQAALVFLVLQETLEQSLTSGRIAVPSFAPSTWLLVIVALVLFAAILVLAGRLGAGIVSVMLGSAGSRTVSAAPPLPPPLSVAPRRRNPLADRRGLRAPPLLAA
jgi:hypothetical protein